MDDEDNVELETPWVISINPQLLTNLRYFSIVSWGMFPTPEIINISTDNNIESVGLMWYDGDKELRVDVGNNDSCIITYFDGQQTTTTKSERVGHDSTRYLQLMFREGEPNG